MASCCGQMDNWETRDTDDLVDALLSLRNKREAKRFLRDLLTESELLELANRLKAARMLYEQVPYTTIEQELGLSSTTVARISKWLNHGRGGYRLILDRLAKRGESWS